MCPSAVQGQLVLFPVFFSWGRKKDRSIWVNFRINKLIKEDPRSGCRVIIRSAREKEAMRFKRWSTGLVGKKTQ